MPSPVRALIPVLAAAILAAAAASATEPVATFSIVGFDPETGELGVAVQSKFFAVGAVVPWAKAGVGAIATQAFANTTYGPRGLEMLAAGKSAQETLDALVAADDPAQQKKRQAGIVDAKGGVAAYTGEECMAWAGHEKGEHFTAQGNILVDQKTVAAMANAFRTTEGMLGEKLMRALEAGQAAGGDSRGQQSAAILIVKEGGGYAGYDDRWCDLRVDDHAEPIQELRRIFDMWSVDANIRRGYQLVDEKKFEEAFALASATSKLDPENGEVDYHWACWLSRGGETAAAMQHLRVAMEREPSLAQQARTDPDLEPLRADPMFEKIVGR
jgi:uncharacterized Ntn-hydrolase superfamily protein